MPYLILHNDGVSSRIFDIITYNKAKSKLR